MTEPASPSQQKVSYVFTRLYQSHQYYSPYKMSTQEQLIDEIQSLGDEILYFEEESVIIEQKEEINQLIRVYHGSLERKQKVVENGKRSRNGQNTKAKHNRDNRKPSPELIKNHVKTLLLPKRQILITKFLREKTKQKLNRSKQQNIKTSLTKQPPKLKPQTPKSKPMTKINQSPKFLQNIEYDYNKFITKNIPKIVNDLRYQKEVLQPSNGHKFNGYRKHIMNKDILNQTHRSKEKSIYTEQQSLVSSRQKLNQTFSTLYTNSKTMLQKKQQKIQNYREQRLKKEMQEATFEPKTFTISYKSKNSSVGQNPSLKNFYQRQKITKQTQNKKKLQKLSQIMQECPFKPRLNVNSRHADSIVREIWRSTSREGTKQSIKQNEKISQKMKRMTNGMKKEHERKLHYRVQEQKVKKQYVEISVISRNQLNFLLE